MSHYTRTWNQAFCRKIPHPDRASAEEHAQRLRTEENHPGERAYLCLNCGFWHVGHFENKRERRRHRGRH